jgi:hypothetical protein
VYFAVQTTTVRLKRVWREVRSSVSDFFVLSLDDRLWRPEQTWHQNENVPCLLHHLLNSPFGLHI